MSQVLAARVTCPNCQTQFQTPVEQVLDVRADPAAKMRVLNGLVNMAVCPQCRTGGALNLPFFYHDPDNELALVYMPMESSQDNLERQRAIGEFTRAVMDALPAEERKGYLLQPHVFLTLENLTNKILEVDGVTPEMVEDQKAKAELLRRMVETTSDETLEAMIKENDDVIDGVFLRTMALNMEMAQAARQATGLQRLLAVREKLLELSSAGQEIKKQEEMLQALQQDPTRDTLVDLLVQAPDEETREMLIVSGRSMLDYPFFQALTARIDSLADDDEKERLSAVRTELLEVRDRLDAEARALYEQRSALLRDLLLSSNPESLARRRFPEMDQAFMSVLSTALREAEEKGDEQGGKALQALWNLVLRLMEETLPPEVRLFNRLMAAEDGAQVDRLLQDNRALVTERFVGFVEGAGPNVRQTGPPEAADRLNLVLEKARAMLLQGKLA